MKKLLLMPLAACLFATACGTEPKSLGQAREEKGRPKPRRCPPANDTYHQLTLILKEGIPAKLALEINGRRELDECREADKVPPAVFGERDGKKFTFIVMHGGAYPQLPATISFRLLSLDGCTGPEAEVFSASGIPLQFETDYPNGASCPSRTHAAKELIQP